jgi:hypothetical protein
MTGTATYPTLDYFFGVYMHQDWADDYVDEWAAVDAFVAENPPEAPDLFRAEIALVFAKDPTEEGIRHLLLDDFGAAAMMENRGWKYRDWLQALSDHAAKATGHPQAS